MVSGCLVLGPGGWKEAKILGECVKIRSKKVVGDMKSGLVGEFPTWFSCTCKSWTAGEM